MVFHLSAPARRRAEDRYKQVIQEHRKRYYRGGGSSIGADNTSLTPLVDGEGGRRGYSRHHYRFFRCFKQCFRSIWSRLVNFYYLLLRLCCGRRRDVSNQEVARNVVTTSGLTVVTSNVGPTSVLEGGSNPDSDAHSSSQQEGFYGRFGNQDYSTVDLSTNETRTRLQREEASNSKYNVKNYPRIRQELLAGSTGTGVGKGFKWAGSVVSQSVLVPERVQDLNRFMEIAVKISKNMLVFMDDYTEGTGAKAHDAAAAGTTAQTPSAAALEILQLGIGRGTTNGIAESEESNQQLLVQITIEIYLQIIKQITENPKQPSIAKGWQLLCLCITYISYSYTSCVGGGPGVGGGPAVESYDSFHKYLINYLSGKRTTKGAVGGFARYALGCLEDRLDEQEFPPLPSLDIIKTWIDRPPALVSIGLVDGEPLLDNLPLTPDMDCEEVVKICIETLAEDSINSGNFGIFVLDREDNGLTGRPLKSADFIGDVLVVKAKNKSQGWKFVFKRKVYLKNAVMSGDDDNSNDGNNGVDGTDGSHNRVYRRLSYKQAREDILIGNVPLEGEEMVMDFVCKSLAVEVLECAGGGGGDGGYGGYGGGYESSFEIYVEGLTTTEILRHVPHPWRKTFPGVDQKEKILAQLKNELSNTSQEMNVVQISIATSPSSLSELEKNKKQIGKKLQHLQSDILNMTKNHKLFGAHFFHNVKKASNNNPKHEKHLMKFPESMVLAINGTGLHFLDDSDSLSDSLSSSPQNQTIEEVDIKAPDVNKTQSPPKERTIIASYPFENVYRWGGGGTQFSLILYEESVKESFEFILDTKHAAGMACIILDFIQAIMKARK